MPESFLTQTLPKEKPLSDRRIHELASEYQVSTPAMPIRLMQLGYRTPYSA